MKNESNNPKGKREKNLDKKVLMVSEQIFPYVKNRILVLEKKGVLPLNMYKPGEIIDEVVLELFERVVEDNIDVQALKLLMFSMANEKLSALFEKEKWHKRSISIKLILEEELKQMEEYFTVDGDSDFVMIEELDDISYHQQEVQSRFLESDEIQQDVISLLELKDKNFLKSQENRQRIKSIYEYLPIQTSNVVDLYVLGKLNLKEIAGVLDTDISEVKKIIQFVKENIKKHIE
jgi:DNA-directed RNA polymerase specialized sigma24 family protein